MARIRGTAVVETPHGILVTLEGRGKDLLLPGGAAEGQESGVEAAIRELREETGLETILAASIFYFKSRYNQHLVCYLRAVGQPKLGRGVKYIGGYQNGVLTPILVQPRLAGMATSNVSSSTRAIIQLYRQYRQEKRGWFETVDYPFELKNYGYSNVDPGP